MGALVLNRKAKSVRLNVVDRVLDDAANVGIEEGLAGLVAGLEVEDSTCASVEDAACTEDEAVLKPCAEDQLLRLGNVEGLGVELLALDEEVVGNACGDGVAGAHVPDDFLLVTTPLQVAVRADDRLEGLGVVARVQGDEAHLAEVYALSDLFYESVVDLLVRHMAPPDQDVGIFKNLVGKTLIGIVECGEANFEGFVFTEEFTDDGVKAVGVNCLDGFLRLFVTEFVPDGNLEFAHVVKPNLSYISV